MKTLLKNLPVLFGLVSSFLVLSCEKTKQDCPDSEERIYSVSGFTRVNAGENFQVTVRQGEAFMLKAEGCTDELEELKIEMEDGELDVSYRKWRNNRYRVNLEITMPALDGFSFSGIAKATLSGFDPISRLESDVSGDAEVVFTGDAELVDCELSGSASLELKGSGKVLIADLSGASQLRAYTFPVEQVNIDASGSSKAWLSVSDILNADASGSSNIYYKGNPSTDIELGGTAKVRKES